MGSLFCMIISCCGQSRYGHTCPSFQTGQYDQQSPLILAGQSLNQSARLNGHDPLACLKDVLIRLPTTKQKDIETCCLTTGGRLRADRTALAGRMPECRQQLCQGGVQEVYSLETSCASTPGVLSFLVRCSSCCIHAMDSRMSCRNDSISDRLNRRGPSEEMLCLCLCEPVDSVSKIILPEFIHFMAMRGLNSSLYSTLKCDTPFPTGACHVHFTRYQHLPPKVGPAS